MRLAVPILLPLFVAVPLLAQAPVQSRDGKLGVVAHARGPRVVDDLGRSAPVLLPEDVRLNSLIALDVGWIAAGVQPVGARRELVFRMLDAGGLKRLPLPGGRTGPLRHGPVLLARDGRLDGVMWLEGEARESLALRASRWLGITWSAPVTVAPPGPGSQLALEVVGLADGSWLAVWSAFDGEDDEILWSVGIEGSWTEPAPLSANTVPDILPTVVATPEGALVAWNRLEGDEYRLVSSRLREGRWIEGPSRAPGSLYPELIRGPSGPLLAFLQYVPGGGRWHLQELDGEATRLREGSVPARGSERPLLLRRDDRWVVDWPRTGGRTAVDWSDAE